MHPPGGSLLTVNPSHVSRSQPLWPAWSVTSTIPPHPSSTLAKSLSKSVTPSSHAGGKNWQRPSTARTARSLPFSSQQTSELPNPIPSRVHLTPLAVPDSTRTRFGAPLPPVLRTARPRAYVAGLAPAPSPLRPHVLASDRLRAWRPLYAPIPPEFLSSEATARVAELAWRSYAENTASTYGSGLLLFHVWCDLRQVPEPLRAPTSAAILAPFVSDLAGSYSQSAIVNAVAAVHAWHIVHGLSWPIPSQGMEDRISALIKGAGRVAPPSSVRALRDPLLVSHIADIRAVCDFTNPLDVAVFGASHHCLPLLRSDLGVACLATVFWTTARLGEFVVPSLKGFRARIHITPRHVTKRVNRDGAEVTNFRLPWTKCSDSGEDVYWARQTGDADPEAAWLTHVSLNDPPPDGPLFAYREHPGARKRIPLTRKKFLDRFEELRAAADIIHLTGHSLRIGGTLELLLQGKSFEVVKTKGRWKSDAFQRYLRLHGTIMASYIQEGPIRHGVIQYTLVAPR